MRGKKTKRKWLRNITILLLIILVLLVFDNRFGLGAGLSNLLKQNTETTEASTSETATTESTETNLSARTIRISEQSVYFEDAVITIEALREVLMQSDANVVYTLKDDLANHALFVEVQTLLDELKHIYTIE